MSFKKYKIKGFKFRSALLGTCVISEPGFANGMYEYKTFSLDKQDNYACVDTFVLDRHSYRKIMNLMEAKAQKK